MVERQLSTSQQKFNDALRARLEINRSLRAHQIRYGDFVFRVDEQVFSPKLFAGWRYYTPLLSKMNLAGKRFLEIGCGCGITGLYLAGTQGVRQLVLADVNPCAVSNAKHNAESLGLRTEIAFYESDVFDGIPNSAFDVIYWNHPWEQEKSGYRHRDELEKGLFDGGYQALRKFLKGLPDFLEPSGQAMLGMGISADLHLFYKLCHEHGFHPYEVTDPQQGLASREYILYEISKPTATPPSILWKATIFKRQRLLMLKTRAARLIGRATRFARSRNK
jgi:release factor glutamine methyltransferase